MHIKDRAVGAKRRKSWGPAREIPRESVVPQRKNAPPRGASLERFVAALERDHPDLAEQAPVSSASAEAGVLVKAARHAAALSQRELAVAAGLQQSAISAIERGDGRDGPTFRKLRAVAEALGMRIAFIDKDRSRKGRTRKGFEEK